MKKIGPFLLAVFALSALLPNIPAIAQGIITGKINGSVSDPTGAVIPNATVTAVAKSTNSKITATSHADGSFNLLDLPVGVYTVTISGPGFSSLTLDNVEVGANRTSDLGTEKLQAGGTSATVEVSAAQNLLETSAAQVTTTFDAEQLTNLPTAGGFDELALLIPGVVDTHAQNFSNTNGVGISVNGERGRANNFELDGQSNNDNSVAGPQVFFGNDEALSQIQIITNDFGAQYGRNAGSVVNYITKSGTNAIHGSAIYKYSGDFTSSLGQGYSKGPEFGFCSPGESAATTGCAPPVVPRYVQNYYGGTIGGPIIKDKLFAFGSTYFYRLAEYGALTSSGTSLFPTPAGLTALASAFPGSPGVATLQLLNPYAVTVGNPRQTGPTINETVTNSAGTPFTIPFAQFARQVPTLDTDQEDLGRIDYQVTPKDRFYVRYFYQKEPDFPGDTAANGGFYDVSDVAHSVGADETHTFGPHWVNQLRYSFQQTTLAFNAGGFQNCTISAFTACPSSVSVAGTLSDGSQFTGLGLPSNLPQGRVVKVGQVQDNANWSIGRHSITFGGEFDYTNSPNTFLPDSAGVFNFDNLNDFLNGSCATGASCYAQVAVGKPVIPFKEDDVALYFQDDWKILPSLTLNLGLRWEFFQQAINLLHNESVANQTGSSPLWSTSLPLSQTTLPSIPNYYGNFEPRLGFAWNPEFNKKLVIRGGYAINVDPAFYNINLNVATSAPLVTLGTVNCTGTTSCLPSGGANFANVQAYDTKLIPSGGNPGEDGETSVGSNFKNPLGQTYTLAVEYQIRNAAVVEARYTGNHTSRQFQSLNANPYLLPVATDFPNIVAPASLCSAASSTLPNGADIGHLSCGTSEVNSISNTAFSQYNSLQTKLTTRSYHGVTATFAYTHSKLIDNSSEIYSTAGGGNTSAYAQNPLDTNFGEHGTSGLDFPNTASSSFVYQFPKLNYGNSLVKGLTNGWRANTIWIYESGQPYTDFDAIQSSSPQANGNDPRTYNSYSDQAFEDQFVGFDVARPILSNKHASAQTLGIYTTSGGSGGVPLSAPFLVDYKTGAPVSTSQVRFIANNMLAAQIVGNPYPGSSRNVLRGDTTNDVDFSVFKDTKFTERITFRLQAEAYNVLNRAFYGTPGNYEGDYAGGVSNFNNYYYNYGSAAILQPGTGTRNMIFTGKILF